VKIPSCGKRDDLEIGDIRDLLWSSSGALTPVSAPPSCRRGPDVDDAVGCVSH